MYRPLLAMVTLTAMLSHCGCSSRSPAEPAETSAASAVESALDGSSPGSPTDTGAETVTQTVERFDSAEDCFNAMQRILSESATGKTKKVPSLQGVNAALSIGDLGREDFPEDENLLRAVTSLRYQFLPLWTGPEKIAHQRELGELARLLLDRNRDKPDLGDLGNMPAILLLEAAKGLVETGDPTAAWGSVLEARSAGLEARLVLLEEKFASLVQNETNLEQVRQWLLEDSRQLLQDQRPFPFDFRLRSLSDENTEVSLEDSRGKITVVDVWETTCLPCRHTIPELVTMQERFADDVAFVGINFEKSPGELLPYEEAKKLVDAYQQTQPMNYPCLFGTTEVAELLPGVGTVYPTLVFIGRTGEVRLLLQGYHPAELIESVILNLLQE